jgi:hypothetical protein
LLPPRQWRCAPRCQKTRELWTNFPSLELVIYQSHTLHDQLLTMIVIHPLRIW